MPRAPKLRVPHWVPKPVADYARREYAAQHSLFINFKGKNWTQKWSLHEIWPDNTSIIRLTCDPRMRVVWQELRRRHTDGSFMWPANTMTEAPSPEERQNAAMAELFRAVELCKMRASIAVTRREAEQRHREVLEKAKQLRDDATVLLVRGLERFGNGDLQCKRFRVMMAAVQVFKEYAKENFEYELRTASERKTRNARGYDRWFVLNVADKCQALFGNHMYGVTATIASVALNRNIGERLVRQWVGATIKAPIAAI
jgi:hypothetical protein